jgi:high-affinity iron transporter
MMSALLIALREGLEAALIVGIVMGYLRQIGRRDRTPYAWAGVAVGAILSAMIALMMRFIGAQLETPFEQIFEGTTIFLAVAILTWMIFWMRYQGRFLKSAIELQIRSVVTHGETWGLFGLAFFAVFREGLETALFLAANAFVADGVGTLVGALIGLALAVAVGVLIYVYAIRLNVSLFFQVTSILLVVFAAGLVARGVAEYQEIGWLPILTNTAWDTSTWVNIDSALGSILQALFGYSDKPSGLQVISYVGYWLIVVQAIRWFTQRLGTRQMEKRAG